MAVIICPAFLLHIATFFYIARIAVREGLETDMSQSLSTGSNTGRSQAARRHRHVITAVKIQWRALLLAIVSCGTVVFYWVREQAIYLQMLTLTLIPCPGQIFYFTQIHKMQRIGTDPTITTHWLECMLTADNNKNQNSCVYVISPHLPPFGLMITAEALVSLCGVWVFLIFGKRSLWREWNDLIYDIRVTLGARGRVEKNGEQFFAL
ncbi:hypothetical protein DFQ29_004697 [Apophysomyces sp. BC1021]|nr:hypothetical protein DFQ29_004697 [Apophysomyces sp. BC1021]